MPLTLPRPLHHPSSLTRAHALIHAECPIETALRSDDPEIQAHLMQEPWSRGTRPEGTLFLAGYNGLRLLAMSERALSAAVNPLQRRFGDRLVVDAPSVRYAFGVPTLEPYMTVLINCPERCLSVVKGDFLHRRGRIQRLQQRASFVLEGEAPLASLLGYEQWILDSMAEIPYVGLWLSRYLPIDDDGPKAA